MIRRVVYHAVTKGLFALSVLFVASGGIFVSHYLGWTVGFLLMLLMFIPLVLILVKLEPSLLRLERWSCDHERNKS